MSNEYVQRQLTGRLGVGDYDTMAQFDPSKMLWALNDVRATTILKTDPGKAIVGRMPIGASLSRAVPLPRNYSSANRIAVIVQSSLTVKAVTVSPVTTTSTVLLRAGTASDQPGILALVDRITSITITNPQATEALVHYAVWELPDDLDDQDVWRDGAQTTGVITTS